MSVPSPTSVKVIKNELQGSLPALNVLQGTTLTILAKNKNVSNRTIYRAVHDDPNMFSYKLYKRQILTDKVEDTRVNNVTKVLNNMNSNNSRNIEEKLWTVDWTIKVQNYRFIAGGREDLPHTNTIKFPASIMTLGVIRLQSPPRTW